jgi:GAF domain-containing protein
MVLFEPDGSQGRVAAEFPAIGTHNLIIPVRGIPTEERFVQAGEPLVLSDSRSDPALGQIVEIWRRFDIRSVLIVPVVFHGRVLGSFSLDAIGRSYEFGPDEIDLCQIFAAQVAVAIERAKLFADLKRRADQLDMVRQTTLAITSQLDRDALLLVIIQQAVALLHARSGGIYEYHPERGALVIVADYGRPDELRGKQLEPGEGMAGRLLASGESFLIAVPERS